MPDARATGDQHRVVGVNLVVEVQQLDGPAGVRERERDPARRPALRPHQRQHVRRVHGRVLAHLRHHVAAERQRRLPQPLLTERAAVDLHVASGFDLLAAEVDRLRQRRQVGVRPSRAELLVHRHLKQPGLLAGCQLAEQPLVLALLDVAIEVRHPAAGLRAAVDREQPPVGELQPLALAATLERVHEHAERERLPGQHRAVQPPHRRPPGGRGDHDRLLGAPIDVGEMRVPIEIEARRRHRLAQPPARLDRRLPLHRRVELAQHLPHSGRPSSEVGLGRVEARPQQMHDPLAVEQLGRHPLGLELGAQRVDPPEVLADRPAVRRQRPLERRRRQLPAPRVGERGSGDVLARQKRHDHVVVDLDRRLIVGVQPQRLLQRSVQPPARNGQRIVCRRRAARRRTRAGLDLAPAVRQQLAEVHRAPLDHDLDPLVRVQLRDQPLERRRGLLALLAGHQQRVHRGHAEDPHERALARDHQAGTVDRLDRQQLARLTERLPLGPGRFDHRHSGPAPGNRPQAPPPSLRHRGSHSNSAVGIPRSPRLPSRLSSSASSTYPVMSPHPGTNLAAARRQRTAERTSDHRSNSVCEATNPATTGSPPTYTPVTAAPSPRIGLNQCAHANPIRIPATIAAI